MSVVTVLPQACKQLKTSTLNTPTNSIKSMDSIYSANSKLSRRKINQKNRDRNPVLVPAVSEIKQRVMSARMLRMKQLQNQISEAHHRNAELTSENRLLKSLHKRQDSALSKFQNTSAELPKLLNSHAEELRMWTERCRNLQQKNKELQAKIKQKDTIILTLTDENKYFSQLNKDKTLLERAYLQERVKVLEQRYTDKENEIKLIARRLQLETKAHKSSIYAEQLKYRDLLMKIEMSDFLLNPDNKKISPKSSIQKGINRNKSPSNRLIPKSATSLPQTQENNNKDEKFASTMTILPCNGDTDQYDSSSYVNNNNNSNVKPMPEIKTNDDNVADEIDLNKNITDKSEKLLSKNIHDENCKQHNGDDNNNNNNKSDDDDNLTIRVKNGMHDSRQNAKTQKLSPMHQNNSIKNLKHVRKSHSDESELSDDDFNFINHHHHHRHNGTRMAAQNLLDHKMHISELENKMKQNSLDNESIISSNTIKNSYTLKASDSSASSHDEMSTIKKDDEIPSIYSFDCGDSDIITITQEIREDTMRRESYLDEYCETFVDSKSHYSNSPKLSKIKKLEFSEAAKAATGVSYNYYNGGSTILSNKSYQAYDYIKPNGHANRTKGKIDQDKKKKLLASLKNIDNSSTEN